MGFGGSKPDTSQQEADLARRQALLDQEEKSAKDDAQKRKLALVKRSFGGSNLGASAGGTNGAGPSLLGG